MAGGTWIDQNKVIPGVYINYKSAPSSIATMGERGTVTIARVLDWGERGKLYTITDPSDCQQFGHYITDAECLFLRQILLGTNRTQGASKVLLWSLEASTSDTAASLKIGDVTYSAKTPGEEGNKLAIEIVSNSSAFDFSLYNGGVLVKTLTSILSTSEITDSDITSLISFGSGDLLAYGKTNLSGGSNGANKASAIIGNLIATARYEGTFGNRLSVVITADNTNFIVQTLLDGQAVDAQVVSAISGLAANDYVEWSGTGSLAANAGVSLTGGSDGHADSTSYQAYREAIAQTKFDVCIYDGTDSTEKSNFAQFIKSQSNDDGNKCQLVVSDYASADSECVISVYSQTMTLLDGTVISPEQLTWWIGGASAGANAWESLTYAAHPDASSIYPKLTKAQQTSAINAGHIALIEQFDRVQVLTDIDTFHSFTVTKGKLFKKNRVIRTVFGICNDIYLAYSLYYIGATNNDDFGRNLLKSEFLGILNRYQGNGAVQNVVADDVIVNKGVDSDAVVIEAWIQPIDSVEKIYINIIIS